MLFFAILQWCESLEEQRKHQLGWRPKKTKKKKNGITEEANLSMSI